MWKKQESDMRRLLGRCRFKKGGGSKTTTSRTIPNATGAELSLQDGLTRYNQTGLNNAAGVLSRAVSSIDRQYNPDWNALAGNYNNISSQAANGYSSLMRGELPSAYAAARQKALADDLKGTVGNSISSLASRGVLNSSVTNKALDDVSKDAASQLAKSYASDLAKYSSILGAAQQSGLQTLAGNQLAQNASEQKTNSLFDYANQLANPAQQMWGTMYSGRMGTGTTSQQTTQQTNPWSVAGTLGSAFILCFTGDTLVTIPNGYRKISDILPGDEVLSLDASGAIVPRRVKAVTHAERRPLVHVHFDNGTLWHTTQGQRFYNGTHFVFADGTAPDAAVVFKGAPTRVLYVVEGGEAPVYDLILEGGATENIFFANDVAAEGFGD